MTARFTRRLRLVWLVGSVSLVLGLVASAAFGPVVISPKQIFAILGTLAGLDPWVAFGQDQYMVLMAIRLPRVVLAALVGAAFAVSGTLLQGMFRNPLASPMLIGTSAGAMLGAVAFIVLGSALFSVIPDYMRISGTPLAAFAGGGLTTLLVYRIATAEGRTAVGTMLLAGIAINALALALTGFLITLANDAQLRTITFWNLGGLGGAGWKEVLAVTAVLVPLGFVLPALGRPLNVLLLGEREARHLGVRVETIMILCVTLTALAVGAAVSMAGNIQFVGLVVPNLLRLMLGPDHRLLLPASAFGGAVLMILADLVARLVIAPAELPAGIVTAALGAPFFLWLLLRHRKAAFV